VGKYTDALKPIEEFTAPWETASGEKVDPDLAKLKRHLYNLMRDKAEAQDAREEAKETLTKAEKDLEDAKAEAADANGAEAQKKIDRLEKKVSDLTAERDKLVSDQETATLRAEVLEGVDPKHAKHVKGETREELEKSLAEIREDFGIADPNDGDEDGDEDEPKVRNRPRSIKNPADPEGGRQVEAEIDFDKVADDIVGTSIFR